MNLADLGIAVQTISARRMSPIHMAMASDLFGAFDANAHGREIFRFASSRGCIDIAYTPDAFCASWLIADGDRVDVFRVTGITDAERDRIHDVLLSQFDGMLPNFAVDEFVALVTKLTGRPTRLHSPAAPYLDAIARLRARSA
ncbi:MAG TPA: hypothetical protein VG994_16420 [Steroidobacteraceae bacterium]|nr:hypothetical protein [Steroidobacteraceae bacterium]